MTLRHLSLFRHHFIPTIQTGYPLYSLNATSICLRKIRGRTISSGRRGWQKNAGQIVGRITAQIDTLHRERYGEDTGHFGMIDAIDDPQVFCRVVWRSGAWLKSQGASKISGAFQPEYQSGKRITDVRSGCSYHSSTDAGCGNCRTLGIQDQHT